MTLTIFIGCEKKQSKISELSPIDSLGWNEDDCTFKFVTDMEIIDDELFVCDGSTAEINVISTIDNSFKRCIATKGAGPKELSFPTDMFIREGNLFVSDFLNSRIKEIDVFGNIVSNITGFAGMKIFEKGNDIIIRSGNSNLKEPLLTILSSGISIAYLNPELIFDKYVKSKKNSPPYYVMEIVNDLAIYAFIDDPRTVLCINLESNQVSEWKGITKEKYEAIFGIKRVGKNIYFSVAKVVDGVLIDPNLKMVKTDLSGNILKEFKLAEIATGDTFIINNERLYIFDHDNASIKIYDLEGI